MKVYLNGDFDGGSAGSPFPGDGGLSASALVRDDVLSLVDEIVVGSVVVIKEVQVSWIEEVTVFGVAEINDSAFFGLVLRVGHQDAMVAEALLHSTDAIEGDEALWKSLGLVVPIFACVGVV